MIVDRRQTLRNPPAQAFVNPNRIFARPGSYLAIAAGVVNGRRYLNFNPDFIALHLQAQAALSGQG